MRFNKSGLVLMVQLGEQLLHLKASYEYDTKIEEAKIIDFIVQGLFHADTLCNDAYDVEAVIKNILHFVSFPSSLTLLCPALLLQAFFKTLPVNLQGEVKGFILSRLKDWLGDMESAEALFAVETNPKLAQHMDELIAHVKKQRQFHKSAEKLYQYHLQAINQLAEPSVIDVSALDEAFIQTLQLPDSSTSSSKTKSQGLTGEVFLLSCLQKMADIAAKLPTNKQIKVHVEKPAAKAGMPGSSVVDIKFEMMPLGQGYSVENDDNEPHEEKGFALTEPLYFTYNCYQAKLHREFQKDKHSRYAGRRFDKHQAFQSLLYKKENCTPADFYQAKATHPLLFDATLKSEALSLWMAGKDHIKACLWEQALQADASVTLCITHPDILKRLSDKLTVFSKLMPLPSKDLVDLSVWKEQRSCIAPQSLPRYDKKCVLRYVGYQSERGELQPKDLDILKRIFVCFEVVSFSFIRSSETKSLVEDIQAHLKELLWVLAGGEGPSEQSQLKQLIVSKKAQARFPRTMLLKQE